MPVEDAALEGEPSPSVLVARTRFLPRVIALVGAGIWRLSEEEDKGRVGAGAEGGRGWGFSLRARCVDELRPVHSLLRLELSDNRTILAQGADSPAEDICFRCGARWRERAGRVLVKRCSCCQQFRSGSGRSIRAAATLEMVERGCICAVRMERAGGAVSSEEGGFLKLNVAGGK